MINRHTIERLVIYNRVLKELDKKGLRWATSKKIAEVLSKTSAQVRKDLSFLGKKGKRGVGYNINNLINNLNTLLGRKQILNVAIIGAGNLGRALFYYPGFKKERFEFKAVFDNDEKKIGKKWADIRINHIKDIKRKINSAAINICIITVPPEDAEKVADKIVKAGIKEILNFSPVTLKLPEYVNVRYADLAFELENLSFYISNRQKNIEI